jgi:COMPASS component BRE2
MNNNGTARNGQLKRHKRESRKRREAKGTEASDGPREKKAAAAASSAIPSSELSMMMPILLTDPRSTDVLHPKPRQLNLAFEKQSDVLGQNWEFYEIADKCARLTLKTNCC